MDERDERLTLPSGNWDNTTHHTLLGGTMREAMERAIHDWNDPEWIAEQARIARGVFVRVVKPEDTDAS